MTDLNIFYEWKLANLFEKNSHLGESSARIDKYKKYSGSGLSESNRVLCAVETHFRAYLKSFLTTFRKAQIGECIITKPKKRKRLGGSGVAGMQRNRHQS